MTDFPHKCARDTLLGALRHSVYPEDVMDLLSRLTLAEHLTIEANPDVPCLITLTIMYANKSMVMVTPLEFASALEDDYKLSTRAHFFLLHVFHGFLRDHVNLLTDLIVRGFDRKFETRFLSAFTCKTATRLAHLKLSTLACPRSKHLLDCDFDNTSHEYWETEWMRKMDSPAGLCQDFSNLRAFTFAPCRPLNSKQQHTLEKLLRRMKRLETFGITQRPDFVAPMFDAATFGGLINALQTSPLTKLLLDVSPEEMLLWADHLEMFTTLSKLCLRAKRDMTDQNALAVFLSKLPITNMKVIAILECPIFAHGAIELAKIFGFNYLECFCLCHSSKTPFESINVIVKALRKNQSIRKLLWKHSPIKELIHHGKELALLLERHPTIKEVDIVSAHLEVSDVAWICRRVVCNPTMEALTIGSCEWGIGAFNGVRYLLEGRHGGQYSSHLQKLTLMRMGEDECVMIGTPAVKELAHGIAANKTITNLHLNFSIAEKDEVLFVDAFAQNSSITRLEGHIASLLGLACPRKESMRLEYFLNLNRFGRKLALDSDFPVELWPKVLEKASNENVSTFFYFLQQKPDIFRNIS